jgi:hypothetical protein
MTQSEILQLCGRLNQELQMRLLYLLSIAWLCHRAAIFVAGREVWGDGKNLP